MPSYNLYLSSDKPYRAVYTNEEGMVIYKTETHKLGNTTTISRAVRPIDADNQADETAFAHLAEVEYHTFRTSRIRYSKLPGGGQGEDGKGTPVEEVFRKSGWVGVYGRDRIFTGPDGNEYKWVLGGDECELIAEDEKKTPIASFHGEIAAFTKKHRRPARLEIFEAGANMIDLILITYIYMERLRKEREETTGAAFDMI